MEQMEIRNILADTNARLCTAERWTKGAAARNAEGAVVDPEAPEATCWCLIGATARCAPNQVLHNRAKAVLYETACREFGQHWSLGSFNDHKERSFEDIKAVLAKAIYELG